MAQLRSNQFVDSCTSPWNDDLPNSVNETNYEFSSLIVERRRNYAIGSAILGKVYLHVALLHAIGNKYQAVVVPGCILPKRCYCSHSLVIRMDSQQGPANGPQSSM